MTKMAFGQLMDLADVGDDVFIGPPAPERGQRTFGGQFLAHGLVAAQRTLPDHRPVHSLHGYFLRSGDVDAATELRVERIRDGRSFSSREVRAFQHGTEVFRSLMSFHSPEDGLQYAPPPPPNTPGPHEAPMSYLEYWRAHEPEDAPKWTGGERPMDIRYLNPPSAPPGEPIEEPQLMWQRIEGEIGDDPLLHEAGVAYLADSTLVDHVTLPHGWRWQDDRLTGASLDHAMWFHRPVRPDEWLLYVQRVEATSGGRGTCSGRYYTRSGDLVATCVQEGLMRWAADQSPSVG